MLKELEKTLRATGIPFAHYAWDHAPASDYGVWAEDSARAVWSDGKISEQSVQGTIDLFTKDDSQTPKATIQSALNSLDISWYLNSIQYESDTGFIHYEWVFEVA